MYARTYADTRIRLTGFSLAAALVLSTLAFSANSNAAAVEPASPNQVPTDGTAEKKPAIVEDIAPKIELPKEIEILPGSGNEGSGEANEAGDKGGADTAPNVVEKPLPPTTPLPPIQRDFSKLPVPVARMRELIMAAARSGNVEGLRQLIGSGEDVTMLSLGGIEGDPIEFFKSLSGDDQGHEMLAILLEVLEAGYVRLDAGTDSELYVWPYFFSWPLEKLSPAQKVELFRLITAGDYEDMRSFGGYIFYRVGITPEGRWRFFVAGD